MREATLPSGAILKINPAPFADAKALYQAILEEAKEIKISATTDMSQIYKDLFCAGFSSKKIDAALHKCMARIQYCDGRGDLKIDNDTFEPISAREDYMSVCIEVVKENVLPFGKSLSVGFEQFLSTVIPDQA